jgi:signal transduction histidine kinase
MRINGKLSNSLSLRIFVSLMGVATISAVLAGGVSLYLGFKVLRDDIQQAISESANDLKAAAVSFDRKREIEMWRQLHQEILPRRIGKIIRVLDENNRQIFINYRSGQISALVKRMNGAPREKLQFVSSDRHDYVFWTTTYHMASGPQRILQVALPMPKGTGMAKKAFSYFVPTMLLILLLVGIIALALRRRILKPVAVLAGHLESLKKDNIRDWRLAPQKAEVEFFGGIVESVNDLINRVQESAVFQENWARSIAHEIRTPLMLIHGEVETFDFENASKEELVELRDQMKKDVMAVENIVKTVLAIGNRYSDSKLLMETVDLKESLREFAEGFADTFSIRCRTDFSGLPDALYRLDWRLLRVVVDNLFRNSVKHGRKNVTIDLRVYSRDGEIYLEIQDNGPGLSEEAEKALQNWKRWDPKLGVGLNLCKQIQSLSAWKINFVNMPRSGLLVTVRFPMIKALRKPEKKAPKQTSAKSYLSSISSKFGSSSS